MPVAPRHLPPLRGLKPGWHLPTDPLELSRQPWLWCSQWVMFKPGFCSTIPSGLQHYEDTWVGKGGLTNLCVTGITALEWKRLILLLDL